MPANNYPARRWCASTGFGICVCDVGRRGGKYIYSGRIIQSPIGPIGLSAELIRRIRQMAFNGSPSLRLIEGGRQ